METVKIGKRVITVLTGKTYDSYSTTIKKLTVLQQEGFVQLVPARLAGGMWHLAVALEHTFDAFERKRNIAKAPALEFLVRLLGEGQVGVAIEKAAFGDEDLALVFEKRMTKKIKSLNFEEKTINLEKQDQNALAERTALIGIQMRN